MKRFRGQMIVRWGLWIVVLLGAVLFGRAPAFAYNVPGSQDLLIRPTTRAAVSMHLDMVRSCLPNADLSGAAPKINLLGQGTYLQGGSGTTSYNFTMGSALACISSGGIPTALGTAYVGATFGGEFGSGVTRFNRGTLENTGVTGSAFAFVVPRPGVTAFAEVGVTYLNYASTRSSDLVQADFNALRLFANAGLRYEFEAASWVTRLTGTLTFASQQTSAYTETGSGIGLLGPGFVPKNTFDMFVGTLEGRLGYRFNTVLPYLIASVSQDFSSSSGLNLTSGPIPTLFPQRTLASAGLGLESVVLPGTTLAIEGRYVFGGSNLQGFTFNGRLTSRF